MSNHTLTKLDADPDKREWSGGHFCVKKDGRSAALFLFDYPESMCKLTCTEAEALAAAKSFMAIDDLVDALKDMLHYSDDVSSPKLYSNAINSAKSALEKAGIK